MADIFIALGSNLGNRMENIKKSISLLKNKGIEVVKTSSFIETEPYGYLEQDFFLNGVMEIDFSGSPEELLNLLHEVENLLKRKREIHWGPRTIDLDIIFFKNKIIKKDFLIIPHNDMQNREFVLKPLVEIAPDFIHPVLNKTVRELYEDLQEKNKKSIEY